MQPSDIFVLDLDTQKHIRKPSKPLKQSACTPLFFNAYKLRDAGACIHTHSQHAVMATLLWPGNEFRCSHLEMIKGMRLKGTGKTLSYLDTIVIPIIDNTPDEEDLREGMEKAMLDYPDAPAILVRRHGTYSWGKGTPYPVIQHVIQTPEYITIPLNFCSRRNRWLTHNFGSDWEQAKCQAECLDYLLEIAVKMKLAGIETELNMSV